MHIFEEYIGKHVSITMRSIPGEMEHMTLLAVDDAWMKLLNQQGVWIVRLDDIIAMNIEM